MLRKRCLLATSVALTALVGATAFVAVANEQTEFESVAQTDEQNDLRSKQTEIGEFIDEARELGGDRFVSGWLEHEPQEMVYIRFTEGPEIPEMAQKVEGADFPVEILYDSPYTKEELLDVSRALIEKYHQVNGIDAVYVEDQTMTAILVANPNTDQAILDELEQSSVHDLVPGDEALPDLPVKVEHTDEPAQAENLDGNPPDNDSPESSTIGFAAVGLAFIEAGVL